MNAPSETVPENGNARRPLWALALIALVLVFVPALLAGRRLLDGSSSHKPAEASGRGMSKLTGADKEGLIVDPSDAGPVTTIVDSLADGSQKSMLFIVAVLALFYFRNFVPVLWSVFQPSLSGLLIAAELGMILWLVYGGLSEIGMPGLFWSPYPATMARAGFGVTLFVYWMLYLAFVRDYELHRKEPGRQVWARFRPVLESSGLPGLVGRPIGTASAVAQLRWFLAYAGLPALLALIIPAVMPAVRPGDGPAIVEWYWLAGVALGVAATALIVKTRVATRLHELWRQFIERRIDIRQVINLDPDRLDPHANIKNSLVIVAVIFAASYIDQYVGKNQFRSVFSAALSICFILGVVATFATYLGTRTRTVRLAIVSILLALVTTAGLLQYEVKIRDLDSWYPLARAQLKSRLSFDRKPTSESGKVVNLDEYQKSIRPEAAQESHKERERLLDNWKNSFHGPGNGKPILVVVTTSGGALRAAIWTETVLGYLDQKLVDFGHHVKVITGASGGMLGAARFVSGQFDRTGVIGAPGRKIPVPDYLTPIAWQIAFRDLFPNSLIPCPMPNRGDALEEAWIKFNRGIGFTFGQLKAKEDQGLIPSIIFSPMMVEDGRRLLISNLPLQDLAVVKDEALLVENPVDLCRQYERDNQTMVRPGEHDLEYPRIASVSAVELFDVLDNKGRDRLRPPDDEARNQLKLASAVRMSATFPYVTSSVTLPVEPPRHVVDAGYYDNYGVNLAASWVASHRDWIKENTAGVLVIQTRAFRNERRLKLLSEEIQDSPQADTADDSGWQWRIAHFIPWLVSCVYDGLQSVVLPLEGLAKARDSSMYFRNDEQLRALQRMFLQVTGDPEFFRSVVFTCDTVQFGQTAQNRETLNWYIDPEEWNLIRENMDAYHETDHVTKTGTGRDHNYNRVKSLCEWWFRRNFKASGVAAH